MARDLLSPLKLHKSYFLPTFYSLTFNITDSIQISFPAVFIFQLCSFIIITMKETTNF